jgi:HSP20 family protein
MRNLIPWRRNGVTGFDDFRGMENMLARFFGEPMGEFARFEPTPWAPRVDVEETDKEILITADVPGVDPKDVEVTVCDGSLVVKGEKKEEREENKKNFHRVERFTGSFYREIPLPSGTDFDKISAATAKGVLRVCVPKKAEVLPKKIAVKATV